MKQKKYEIRITLPEKLYEKISKEAERRYTTIFIFIDNTYTKHSRRIAFVSDCDGKS